MNGTSPRILTCAISHDAAQSISGAYHRILKLAHKIADLAGCEEIQSVHLAEALQYRPRLMLNLLFHTLAISRLYPAHNVSLVFVR